MTLANKYVDDDEMQKITRAAQGDKYAFSELFNQYKVMVYRIVCRFLGQAEDADDAVQQIFIELYKSLPGYMGNSKFTTWLYRIAVNVSIQYIRKRKRDSEFDTLNPESHIDSTQNASASIEKTELQKQIAVALEGIHERKRTVLILHDMEGLTMEEIAGITGLPLGTVKSRLFHGRDEMRSKLKKQLGLL